MISILKIQGVTGEVYNIASQQEFTVLEVANTICKLFGLDPKEYIEHVADRLFNDQRYFVDAKKLNALGWQQVKQKKNKQKNTEFCSCLCCVFLWSFFSSAVRVYAFNTHIHTHHSLSHKLFFSLSLTLTLSRSKWAGRRA